MATKKNERNRMIVDLPPDVHMAIKLHAVKNEMTTGMAVCEAVQKVFGKELLEAKTALADIKASKGK